MSSSEQPQESSRPDRIVLADASGGKLGEQGGFVSRFGITGAKDADDGSPIIRPEDGPLLDARTVRVHDMRQDTPDGIPDRRVTLQAINDWPAEYTDAKDGENPYNQPEKFSAANRSTRHVDGEGRVAIPPSVQRIVDSEDGRCAISTTCNEIGGEPPPSEINKPGAGGAPAAGRPLPPGIVFREATGQGLNALSGVVVNGLFIAGEDAKARALDAINAGLDGDDVARAARGLPPINPPAPPPPADADAAPLPPPPTRASIAAQNKPAGYVSSVLAGQTYVGLLGTYFSPASGEPIHRAKDGTPIGTLPRRWDAQVALDLERRGPWAIADDDVADVPEGDGPLVKGWLCPDTSLAGRGESLPGSTFQLRPVIRVSSDQIAPPPNPPPPYVDPREKREKEEERQREEAGGRKPEPARGPAEGSGSRRPEEEITPPPKRETADPAPATVNAILGHGTIVPVPVGVTATGELAKPVANPQAQGRDFSAPGVPCPNATGGVVLTGERAMRGGTTGTPPLTPTVSHGHPGVVHTGDGLLIGPAQLIGGGAGGAASVVSGGALVGGAGSGLDVDGPLTAQDLAAGAGSPKLADRFVDRQGRPVSPRGLDVEADPRIPVNELDEAIPVSAFPANRQAIVRVKRENARKREQAQAIRDAAKVSGVERRRAQNERDHRINTRDIDRRIDETQQLRDAAAKRQPPDPRRVEDLNRQLHRLGQERVKEGDRFDRQQERLDRSQRQLDAQRRAAAKREAAKAEQRRRREERARNPRQPRGGLKVETMPSPLADQASSSTGWIGGAGPEEQAARERAAQSYGDDYIRSQETNDQLSDEGRAALGLPPREATPSLSGQFLNTEDELRNAVFGGHNVLTTPAPIFGEAGGPASVGDALRILGAQLRALQAVVGGAFGGPAYLAGNVAVQHENTPGNPPAPSSINSHWTAGAGEKLEVGRGTPTLEVAGKLEAQQGGLVEARTGCILNVIRELYDATAKVFDQRPAVLVEERTASGQGSGAEAIATMDQTGAGWSTTHDGKMRLRLADGSFWEFEHKPDNSIETRKHLASNPAVATGGTALTEDGRLASVGSTGTQGPALDAARGVLSTPDLAGASNVGAGDPGLAISDGLPVYTDAAGDVHAITGGSGSGGYSVSSHAQAVLGYFDSGPFDNELYGWGGWGINGLRGDYTADTGEIAYGTGLRAHWYYKIADVSMENTPAEIYWDIGPTIPTNFTDAMLGAIRVRFYMQYLGDTGANAQGEFFVYDPADGTTEISTGVVSLTDDALNTLELDASDLAGVFEPGDMVRVCLVIGDITGVSSAKSYHVLVQSIELDLSGE